MTFTLPRPLRFTADDFYDANDEWGANCGPGAIAGMLGMTLAELRPLLGDFELRRYTNPTLMFQVLSTCIKAGWLRGVTNPRGSGALAWPRYGLCRVQWEGPWTRHGVPPQVAYRQTHWVGAISMREPLPDNVQDPVGVFDVNAIESGGWTTLPGWRDILVPHILRECVPKADGRWHLTHVIELELP